MNKDEIKDSLEELKRNLKSLMLDAETLAGNITDAMYEIDRIIEEEIDVEDEEELPSETTDEA